MPQKIVQITGLGEINLYKRKHSRHLRLSVNAKGQIRVSMPSWVPYAAGVAFAKQKSDWIIEHRASHPVVSFKNGQKIGKSYRLFYYPSSGDNVTYRLGDNEVRIYTNQPIANKAVQSKATKAAEQALMKESNRLLLHRLKTLAERHKYQPHSVKIKKMTSRWGSCSSTNVITLSCYLVQLPWKLIDYVIIHELAHTKHLNHSNSFWSEVTIILPDAKLLRREIKLYKPRIIIPD